MKDSASLTSRRIVKTQIFGLGANIILLGVVSFVTDVSSEMMQPILPMFIVSLGGSALAIGLISGLGDSISSILQLFSGYWSDRYGKRRPFVFSGYIISAVCKVLLAFSTIWQHVLVVRPLERVGKGLRTAPRDAIIADSAMTNARGKAFGFHRAMDTGGAIFGSIGALVLFWFLDVDLRFILLISAAIAFLALPPIFWVKEKRREPQRATMRISLKALPEELRWFVLTATVFALGNFSYMFFILKAQDFFSGIVAERAAVAIPLLLYVLFNVVYTSFAIPIGILSDKVGRPRVLLSGYILFGLTCLGFAFASSLPVFVVLFCLYGLVYAIVEATQRAFVSDLAFEEHRGIALGTFHTLIGLATLPAGVLAGALWNGIGSRATFGYGGVLGFLAAILLVILIRRRARY